MAAANTITINDHEYDIDQMGESEKYLAHQIDSQNRKMASIQFDLEAIAMAKQGFVNALAASLENQEEDNGEISGTSAPED